jgi:hypothetical protein
MPLKPLADLALIALGAASLAWPEIEYTRASHDARPGPLAFTVKEKDTVRIPVWVGLAAVAAGTGLVWRRRG